MNKPSFRLEIIHLQKSCEELPSTINPSKSQWRWALVLIVRLNNLEMIAEITQLMDLAEMLLILDIPALALITMKVPINMLRQLILHGLFSRNKSLNTLALLLRADSLIA